MRRNNKPIVIIGIIFTLVIVGVICVYLFIKTDIFKSNKVLFTKYFLQNAEMIEKNIDLQAIKSYKNLKNESKYELITDIKTIHSEGGEISNPLNNISGKLEIQKNNDNQYMYENAQVLYEGEQYLNAELIKEQQQYGIRFSDVAKKFVTIQKEQNLEAIASDIGIEVSQLESLINLIDGNEETITEEQKKILKDKYSNIITTVILNGTFEKQRNALITYNNVTTETNAYSVLLTSEQVKNILIEILNNAKNETEILEKLQTIVDKEVIINWFDEIIDAISEKTEFPTLKVTVYEQKQKIIRTVLEIGMYKITVENTEQDGELRTNIIYLNNNNDLQYNAKMTKKNTDTKEELEIIVDCIGGEENFTIEILNETNVIENQTNINTEISYKQGITTTSIVIEDRINVGNDFEKIQSLAPNNYVELNSLEEPTRKQFIEQLKKRVSEKIDERIESLNKKISGINESTENIENTETEEQIPQVEINKFNAKFEFYTGDNVSAENVKSLLNIVRNNIAGHVIMTSEATEENEEKTDSSITIHIEKDQTNEESMTKILEQIKDNEKYRVSIFYKESNGLIDYIVIKNI